MDNTIGGTSQPNGWMDNWVDFYRERRLGHQLKLTNDPNLQKMGKKLCDNLEHFFQGIEVRLVWCSSSGNAIKVVRADDSLHTSTF